MLQWPFVVNPVASTFCSVPLDCLYRVTAAAAMKLAHGAPNNRRDGAESLKTSKLVPSAGWLPARICNSMRLRMPKAIRKVQMRA